MIRFALPFALLAGPLAAQDMSAEAAKLAEAIERGGCAVTLANGNDLAARSGLTEDQIKQIEADRAKAEKAAELREEDYQLAYAIDILKGLSALGSDN